MKVAKIIGAVLLGLLILVAIGMVASALNHRSQLRDEAEKYPPSGRMVEVGGQMLHVYAEGEGERTLVFMAGHGTSSPTLDFKPLWMRMVDEYRIVVVEKAGYGWSESSGSPRDLDTILSETRQALEAAGEQGPYVLVPHSMSGLEAIYWGQKYPEEVEAIIGLDPLVPDAEILPDASRVQVYAMSLVSRIGLSRLMPDEDKETLFPLLTSRDLTEEEKEQYVALFYRSAVTRPMLGEIRHLEENVEIAAALGPPVTIPMYFFISEEPEIERPGWKRALTDYLSALDEGKYLYLQAGHYVHYDEAELIAEEAKAFLQARP